MSSLLLAVKNVLPRPLKRWWRSVKDGRELREWEAGGRPVPPPHAVKQRTIREFHNRFPYQVLVETGTFMGDMVEAQRKHFARIYSIELSEDLHDRAVRRFQRDDHITILQGDSGEVLKDLVPRLTDPAVFWLDGHYSGGITARGREVSPILAEIETILTDKRHAHVLLIDDARLFVGDENYPSVETVRSLVQRLNPDYRTEIGVDCIQVYPSVPGSGH